MKNNTKSLRAKREEKIKQFNEGIANNSLAYLKQMNKEVNAFIESNNFKGESYKKVRKQNKEGNDGVK